MSRDFNRNLDVRACIERRQQIEFLKHEADLALAHVGALRIGEHGKIVSVDDKMAGIRPRQTAQKIKERRLSAARRPYDADKFAAIDAQRNPAQRLHIHFSDAVRLTKIDCLDETSHEVSILHETPRRLSHVAVR